MKIPIRLAKLLKFKHSTHWPACGEEELSYIDVGGKNG